MTEKRENARPGASEKSMCERHTVISPHLCVVEQDPLCHGGRIVGHECCATGRLQLELDEFGDGRLCAYVCVRVF